MVGTEDETRSETERTESYVVFQIGPEHYALEVARVQEVLDVGGLTAVPGSAATLVGLFNLRGRVVPVWDLRVPFGLQAEATDATSRCVLMVEGQEGAARVSGLLVDRVTDVLELAPEDLQAIPTLGLGVVSPFVRGLIRHQERFLLVLDLDRVVSILGKEPTADVA